MIYRLSNNQQKELKINARPLLIAVPAPIQDPPNLLQWARYAFVQNEDGQYITGVDIQTILVTPGTSDKSLAGVIGRIVQGDAEAGCALVWPVEVVICRFHPRQPARHKESSVQWPKCAIHDGQRWPDVTVTSESSIRSGERMD